jgi:protein-disulfide isomerase
MDSKQKLNLAIGLGAIALVGAIGSAAYSYNTFTKYERDMATKEYVAQIADTVMELETKIGEPIDTEVLKKFLLDNPDAILKSLAKQRFIDEQKAKKEQKKQLSSLSGELFNDNDPIMGNPNGKHVLVEFIDYNCGACKHLSSTIKKFVESDPEAKVIVKEYPIFKLASSHYSALMGTALFYHKPELYKQFHDSVITQKKATKESIDETLFALGVPKETLRPYLNKAKEQIEKTRKLGGKLQVSGTPTVFFENGKKAHARLTLDEIIATFATQ